MVNVCYLSRCVYLFPYAVLMLCVCVFICCADVVWCDVGWCVLLCDVPWGIWDIIHIRKISSRQTRVNTSKYAHFALQRKKAIG